VLGTPTFSNRPRPEGVALGRPVRAGRARREAPVGGDSEGRPRRGYLQILLEVKFALPRFQFPLLSDVPTNSIFVQPYRAHTVACRPKVEPGHPTFPQQVTVNPNGTLALQKPNRVGHAVLRRDAHAHVDVVGPTMPFQQLHVPLATQNSQVPPISPFHERLSEDILV